MARPRSACVIDDYPTYYPKHVLNVALTVIPCEIHVVDSNGFMAMRAQGRDFSTAYSFDATSTKPFENTCMNSLTVDRWMPLQTFHSWTPQS